MTYRMKSVVLALVIFMIIPLGAHADWTPTETIKVYVGFGAGGGVDTLARVVTNEIAKNTGWNFTVFNLSGGGGSVMAKTLKKEDPDGYAVSFCPSEIFTFNSVNNPKIGYTADDFTYLAAVSTTQCGMVSLVDKPWKTFDDVIEAAKSGQKISVAYQSPKMGMSMKAIQKIAGAEFVLVPVKGGAAGVKNVLGGHVDIAWGAGVQAKYVKAGTMKVLAACEKERLAMSPEAPTLEELGFKNLVLDAQFQFVGPAKMPEAVVSAFAREIKKAVESDKIRDLISEKFSLKAIFKSGMELQQSTDQSLKQARELVAFVKEK